MTAWDHTWNGEQLRAWRVKQGLTVADVSERIGRPTKTIYRWEQGNRPPIDAAHRIVAMTRGAIRYRDIYPEFLPQYA